MLVTVNVPEALPEVVGAKVTLIEVVLPAPTVIGSCAELTWNAGLLEAIAEMTTFTVPVFVTVNVDGALVWPTGMEPKLFDPGDSVAFGATALPASVTECVGLELALSEKFSVAERAPSAVGLNTRFSVAVPPAATVTGRLTGPNEKSPGFAPVKVRAVMLREVVPGLVIVNG